MAPQAHNIVTGLDYLLQRLGVNTAPVLCVASLLHAANDRFE